MPSDGIINGTITDSEASVLSMLKENPHLTINKLVENNDKSLRKIDRIIASLKNKGLISRVGSNKTGYWIVK